MYKILYFSQSYTPHDHRFLEALSGTDHQVHYVRLERGGRQTEDRPVPASIEQVPWAGGREQFRWRDLPRLVFDFRRLVKKTKPDLVHAGPIQTCAFIAALAGSHPLLTMSWGFDLMQDADRNWSMRRITSYVLRNSDFFASDCEATRQKAVSFGMDPGRTVVFPWGVDLQYFHPQEPTAHRPLGITLFCNRSWEPRYGVDVLARAFVLVARQRQDVDLLLLGGGSQVVSLRRVFEDGGVAGRVTCAGQVSQSDLPRYYAMADLFISPSHVDGSSVSLMEALACGLPCLVSDIPANREWVSDGVNGWLFPDGNAEALASRILHIVEHRDQMSRVGHAARHTAEEKADWKRNFTSLLKAYDQTVRSNA
jgi:glycosyltransferase involved in cell wall biosynthesis